MATNIERFRGTWDIAWVDGFSPVLQRGWKLLLGTGAHGASPPEGDTIGFALLEPQPQPLPDGSTHYTLYASTDQLGPLMLLDGQLRWDGKSKDDIEIRIYISLAETATETWLYGTTLGGDPDQVAVWGANDSPPP